MAQRVENSASIHEDKGLIPGLAQWMKDLALWKAVAQIQCGCGCGAAPFNP